MKNLTSAYWFEVYNFQYVGNSLVDLQHCYNLKTLLHSPVYLV